MLVRISGGAHGRWSDPLTTKPASGVKNFPFGLRWLVIRV